MGNSYLEIKSLQWQGVPISIFLRMILARYLTRFWPLRNELSELLKVIVNMCLSDGEGHAD